ncbi:hypothetical protein ARMGADRAFT_984277 [Armillaria gallica]|uniref:Alpha/beta-hydrolase n=1 Tax=Armillaria gallica TaxID=47427 RepID=A0A2H3DUT7_ARMGA|nr:hypothetical protein ARMGADRAFT_984277 [Armillaria gallica]
MLLSFLLQFIPLVSAAVLYQRQQVNENPTVGGDPYNGWQTLPQVTDATLYPDWTINQRSGVKIPVYQTKGLKSSDIKRAVIVLSGKNRDCWYYWNAMNNALYNASYHDPGIRREDISIIGPCFFTEADSKSGAVTDDTLLWRMTTWIDGKADVSPGYLKVSSFDVLDALVSYYMDTTTFPNLKTVVVGGHSAGGQMAQRYAMLRKSTEDDDRLHFWVANPGSLCWLTEDRPRPDNSCSNTDQYKYGLGGEFPAYATSETSRLGRNGLVSRYNGRNMHYAWGTADNGSGDTSCKAFTQGRTHLERGRNFVSMLEDLPGGIPTLTTVDWIEGVSHSNEEMMSSAAGIDKVAYLDVPFALLRELT